MRYLSVITLFLSSCLFTPIWAEEQDDFVDHDEGMLMDHGQGHLMDMGGGMVMGQNKDTLPGSCDRIMQEIEFTVRAGKKYAEKYPGMIYAFDESVWHVKPCAKVTIHFINEDKVRHQWMMHGLPKYIYKSGMFHLEVTGPGKISGTFIVPEKDETYLVHCDISQHMEKGLKGQLVVGKGGVDIPSIPGRTPQIIADTYYLEGSDKSYQADTMVLPDPKATKAANQRAGSRSILSGMLMIGLAFGLLGTPWLVKRYWSAESKATMSDDIGTLFGFAKSFTDVAVDGINALIHRLFPAKR